MIEHSGTLLGWSQRHTMLLSRLSSVDQNPILNVNPRGKTLNKDKEQSLYSQSLHKSLV